MPIKFRCNYCRQFLGISRAQAGGVVDCPTCGRSIRVPTLDGTVQPLSDPELDREDTHLARALDELARLADAPIEQYVSLKTTRPTADENDADNQIPQPLVEPIPIEVPLPPTPVTVLAPMNAALAPATENGAISDRGLLAELASLSAGASATGGLETASSANWASGRGRRTDRVSWWVLAMTLIIFVGGMLTERFVRVVESWNRAESSAKQAAANPLAENELTGRITYKTKDGESQPDRGARILVFPQTRSGTVKLPIIGFRPGDDATDQSVAQAELKALGGGVTTVDAAGHFRLPMEAGSYRLLVLSHFQPRDAAPSDPTLTKFLSEYFDNPEELLGRVQHLFSPLRVKGTGDVWDHSF